MTDIYKLFKYRDISPYWKGMTLAQLSELNIDGEFEPSGFFGHGYVCFRDSHGFEVFFYEDILYYISLEVNAGYDYCIRDHKISFSGGLSGVIDQIRRHDIEWGFYPQYTRNEQVSIMTEGGASLIYMFAEHPEYLSKIEIEFELPQ